MTEEKIHTKRIKLDSDERCADDEEKQWNIKAILSDEYYEPLKRCSIYAGVLSDSKLIAKVMSEICHRMPLNGLGHLKRVNKTKLILCSVKEMLIFIQQSHKDEAIQAVLSPVIESDLNSLTVDDLRLANNDVTVSLLKLYMINREISSEIVALLTEKVEIASAASEPPVLNWQYADVSKDWPCKFHPNKDLEKMYTGTWFTNTDTVFHTKIMRICQFLCKELQKQVSGIAVDPRTKSIVAIGFDETERHPLMHCAMVLIDGVARSQNGGAWNEYLINSELYSNQNEDYTQTGVSLYVRQLITSKFPTIKFGAEQIKSVDENRQDAIMDGNCDNLAKYGPYLCTGYDVYLLREPCIMCSMALTHSRIRTIFFHQTQSTGAICTLTKLQSVNALNHHFQVFHITANG